MIECKHCAGEGGGKDYFGEWGDCPCCLGEGKITPERDDEFAAELAQIDAQIEKWCSEEGAPEAAEEHAAAISSGQHPTDSHGRT